MDEKDKQIVRLKLQIAQQQMQLAQQNLIIGKLVIQQTQPQIDALEKEIASWQPQPELPTLSS